jgi:hypothetical protein
MTLDTLLAILALALMLICHLVMVYFGKNVKLKYKDQRVGVRTKWWRK